MVAPPIKVDLHIPQGATYPKRFQYGQIIDGVFVPLSLTGYTARMQARESYQSPTPFIDIDTGLKGGITIDGTNGIIDILLDADDTDAYPTCGGVYDLELISPAGDVWRFAMGIVYVTPEVTR